MGNQNRPGTAGDQVRVGSEHGRSGIRDVVYDRDGRTAQSIPQRSRDPIAHLVEGVRRRRSKALGEGERDVTLLGHHLRQEGAAR